MSRNAVNNFIAVVDRVEPVAERECRNRTRGVNCDFQIAVDDRRGVPPNAFQTIRNGKPYIVFTASLIAGARNQDELAFIMGHEAAHHIEGHIARQQRDAAAGAILAGVLAGVGGGSGETIGQAQRAGAQLGSRVFAKDAELEADSLGTVIAHRAGYNPVVGARYFNRIRDPGNVFLGTHPPNADRIRIVEQTYRRIR